MGADADFDGYVAARWPFLVRTLVLLGCPEPLAPQVAVSALAEVESGWSRAKAHGAEDAILQRALLDAWRQWRGRHAREESEPGDSSLDPALVAALDRLPDEARSRAVLAALGRGIVTDFVPGVEVDDLRRAADTIDVPAPPVREEVVARRRQRRAALLRRRLVVALPIVLLVAALTWWSARERDAVDGLEPVPVRPEENPVGVAWYVGDQLHLEHAVLTVPNVRQLGPVSGGAAYGDGEGRVVFVADDGTRRVLGTKDPDAELLVSQDDGWVTWAQPAAGGEADALHLVVRELASDEDVVDRPLMLGTRARDVRLIAFDEGILYFADGEGTHALRVETGDLKTSRLGLVDAQSRVLAFRVAPREIRVAQTFVDFEFDVPGTDARLSADGNYVLTRGGFDSRGPRRLYDTRSGMRVFSGLGRHEVAVAAELGPDEAAVYIVALAEDLELRTCTWDDGTCVRVDVFPDTGATPLLAR